MRSIITATAFAFALSAGFAASAADKTPAAPAKPGQVAEKSGQPSAVPKKICETKQYTKYVKGNGFSSSGYTAPRAIVVTLTHCTDAK